MNPQSKQDMEPCLQQVEVELSSPPTSPPVILQPQKLQPIQTENLASEQSQLKQFLNQFNSLPSLGKLIVIGVAAIVVIAILQAVLKLVAAAISLTILAVLLYLAYQFFLYRSTETK